jgi:Ca-activated chloride channel family protein
LTQFAELSNPADRFFILVMGAKPLLVTDWTQPGATLATGIEEGGKVRIKGKAYYDACAFAVGKMNETQLSKRVILVISDGEDSGSKLSRSQLRKLLGETGILMFSIAKTDPANDALGGVGRSILEELSTVCGGRVFFPGTGSEALESFKRVAGEIRHLYAIGISQDSLKGDGKLHPLKVRVNPQPVAGSRGDRLHANVLTRQHLFDPPRASSP